MPFIFFAAPSWKFELSVPAMVGVNSLGDFVPSMGFAMVHTLCTGLQTPPFSQHSFWVVASVSR